MITPAPTGYMNLARIARTHGRKGEVIARPCDDLPFLLYPGMKVWLTPPELRLSAQHTIRSIRPSSQGMIVLFEGINSIDDAEQLVCKSCLVRQSDVDLEAIAQAPVSVLGAQVTHDELGVLGTITEVLQTKAHDVWVVDTPVGDVLLPICDEVITQDEITEVLAGYLASAPQHTKGLPSCAGFGQDCVPCHRASSQSNFEPAQAGDTLSLECELSGAEVAPGQLKNLAAPRDQSSSLPSDMHALKCDNSPLSDACTSSDVSSCKELLVQADEGCVAHNGSILRFKVRLIPGLLSNEQVAALSFRNRSKDM